MTAALVLLVAGLAILGLVLGARAADQAKWRGELVTLRLRFPRGVRPEQVVAWMAGLPPTSRGAIFGPLPVGLEVAASERGIEHRLLVPGPNVEGVSAQLQAAIPGVRLEREATESVRTSYGVELRLTSATFPSGVSRAEASAAALLSSFQPLAEGERIVVQWFFRGAAVPPVPRVIRKVAIVHDEDRAADAVELGGLRRKEAEPLLSAVGRIGISAGGGARRVQLMGRVRAALSVMDAPGVKLRPARLPSLVVAHRIVRRRLPLLGWPLRINAREAAGLLGLPVGELDLPGLDLGGARQLPVNPQQLNEGVVIGVSDHPGTFGRELRLRDEDRLRHLHLVGPTGTGKSTLMAHLAVEDLAAGHGLIVVDPKRDLVEAILDRVPAHRLGDVILLDPTDVDRPVGLNVLARKGDTEAERELVAEHLLGVFQSLWEDSWGPRSDDILRASLMTLCSASAPDGSAFTLVELPQLLTSTPFRKFVLNQPDVPEHVRGFWQWFEGTSPWERSQALAPVLNKVRAFTMRTPIRLLLGQSEGLHLPTLLAERRVVLVPLSAGELGKPAAELLGSLIVAAVWQAVRGRTALTPNERRPIFIALDEFQDVLRLPLDLADLLAQARGLGAGLTLAHQHLGQLPKDVRTAVLGTARSQVVFQVGPDDARTLARGFEPSLSAGDLMGLEAFHFAMRPAWHDRVIRAVTGRALPLEAGQGGNGLRSVSRERFGVARATVEADLKRRLVGSATQPQLPLGRRRKAGT